jgi:hypothetical protein
VGARTPAIVVWGTTGRCTIPRALLAQPPRTVGQGSCGESHKKRAGRETHPARERERGRLRGGAEVETCLQVDPRHRCVWMLTSPLRGSVPSCAVGACVGGSSAGPLRMQRAAARRPRPEVPPRQGSAGAYEQFSGTALCHLAGRRAASRLVRMSLADGWCGS